MSSRASSADNPYVDLDGRTDAELYLMGVLDGTIMSGEPLKKLARIMLPRIREGYKQWHYDVAAATRPVAFIERFLSIPSGNIGVPFILEQYERAWVELMFGFIDDEGVREFQYVLIEVSRKNGKTSLAAAIMIYMLVADGVNGMIEGAPQCYCVASSKGQASLAQGAIWRMIRQSKKLSKYLRKGVISERSETGIINDNNMGYCAVLSSASSHLDGLDVHAVLCDELAAWSDRALFDLVRQGMGARRQPLMICISTQGFVRDGIFDTELAQGKKLLDGEIEDDRFLPILYEQDDRGEIWASPEMGGEELWVKSNPGLPAGVKKWSYMRAQVLKGKNDPNYMPTLLTKDFNILTNAATAYFTREESVGVVEEIDLSSFKYAICGIDAADTIDLNACTTLLMRPGDDHIYRYTMYWVPEATLERTGNSARERDIAPYRQWVADGWMRTCEGNRCDKMIFVQHIQELADMGVYCRAVGYDPWHMDDNTLRNLKMLVGEQNVIPVRQGPQTLSQPLKQMKVDMRDGRIVHDGNPCNVFCAANTSVVEDTNGNIKIVKRTGNARVDGTVSLLIAYKILAFDRWDDYQMAIH